MVNTSIRIFRVNIWERHQTFIIQDDINFHIDLYISGNLVPYNNIECSYDTVDILTLCDKKKKKKNDSTKFRWLEKI